MRRGRGSACIVVTLGVEREAGGGEGRRGKGGREREKVSLS